VELTPLPVEATPQYVLADRQRLKQVLLNLLSNAIKYNRAGGKVTVEIVHTRDGDEASVRLRVIDTGPGIPADKLGRMFSPFERLGAEQSQIEGTGLGLTLSKRMVEMMRGTISVESELGVGSVFSVELPASAAPADARDLLPPPKEQRRLQDKACVLYIEDNLANLKLVERMLAMGTNYQVLAAMQGRMGLELAREHVPELILLDLNLPDLDGGEVLIRLRRDPKTEKIPVIVISADATNARIRRLEELGAAAYLTKPFDVRHFLRTVEQAIAEKATSPLSKSAPAAEQE
jgi:CheY-like chemotaxis protein/anti-sigma regulatory factor (Ser/Thr protein kinase)